MGTGALFLVDKEENICRLEELLEVDFNEGRSWFCGDYCLENGSFLMAADFHPLFTLLPFLERNSLGFVPADQLVNSEDLQKFPALSRFLCESQKVQLKCLLQLVAQSKVYLSETVFRYDETLALDWLEKRFNLLLECLRNEGRLSSSVLKNESYFRKYTFGIFSDYLSVSMAKVLKEKLKIEDDVVVQKEIVQKSSGAELVEPTENYCKSEKAQMAKKEKMSVAQKQLKKASGGTKSLASFLTKKSQSQ